MARSARLANIEEWLEMAETSTYSARVLAQKLEVSPRQLRRYTQTCFGRSPQDWLNEQRLVRAGQLLKKARMVKSVAFQLGFKQVSHFSREFKLKYGVSPTGFLFRSNGQRNVHLRQKNVRVR